MQSVSDRWLGSFLLVLSEAALKVKALLAEVLRHHGLTVATRNLRHFEPTGVPVLDPS